MFLSFFRIYFLIIATGAYFTSEAQNRRNYEGPYSLGDGLIGKATYQYTTSRRDTIKQGLFKFQSVNTDSTEGVGFHSLSYQGNYVQGIKNGKWTFSSKRVKPFGGFQETDYQIIHQSIGREFLVTGNFKEGKANGIWDSIEQNIENSSPTDTLSHIKANYKEGKMNGKIEGIFNGIQFRGNVNDAGFIDGQWVFRLPTLDGSRIEEYRIFKDGVQTSHYLLVGNDTILLEYIGIDNIIDDGEEWERLNVNGKYFEILESANAGLVRSYKDLESRLPLAKISHDVIYQTNSLLENVLLSFSSRDNMLFWNLLDGSEPLSLVTVRLRRIAFTNEENRNLETANKLLYNAREVFSDIFDNPNIEIDRLANKDLMFYYAVLKTYESSIRKISTSTDQFAKLAFEYIDRQDVLKHLLSDISYPESIKFEFREETFYYNYNFPFTEKNEGGGYELLINHLEDILKDLNQIEAKIDKIMESKLSESRLIEKEKLLVKRKDSVLSFYSDANNDEKFNEFHQRISMHVQAYTQNLFKEYASLELQAKIDTIDVVLACLESFEKLYAAQSEIPSRLVRLDESYTRTVWNPYTMTDMQERMKERVYSAFESYLFPFYLDDLEKSIHCDGIENKHRNFELIYRKMMELREQDTRDVERALRGVSSPIRILQILNLNLSIN